jgi:hypothetical protein
MADSTARQGPSYITLRVRSAGPPQRSGARTGGCVTPPPLCRPMLSSDRNRAVETDSAARGPRSLLG